jgi:hypothetical protein
MFVFLRRKITRYLSYRTKWRGKEGAVPHPRLPRVKINSVATAKRRLPVPLLRVTKSELYTAMRRTAINGPEANRRESRPCRRPASPITDAIDRRRRRVVPLNQKRGKAPRPIHDIRKSRSPAPGVESSVMKRDQARPRSISLCRHGHVWMTS